MSEHAHPPSAAPHGGPAQTDPASLLAWLAENDRQDRENAQAVRWRAAAHRIRVARGLGRRPAPTVDDTHRHQCSADTCAPANELAFGAATARQRPAGTPPEPQVYVCEAGVAHICRGDRYRVPEAPEFVPCRAFVQDGQLTCLISGRSHGTTFAGRGIVAGPLKRKRRPPTTDKHGHVRLAAHGETDGDERAGPRLRTAGPADPIVFGGGRGLVLGETAHPLATARALRHDREAYQRRHQTPSTKRVQALVAALEAGTHDPNRMTPTCTGARTRRTPRAPDSPRRRRRRRDSALARGGQLTDEQRATAARRIAALRRQPMRHECRTMLQQIFYHPQRMAMYRQAVRDTMTQACKAQQELVETAGAQRVTTPETRPTHFEALVQFVRTVRPVVFDTRPAETANEEVLRYLETLLLLHWEILLSSPYIQASPTRANFETHALALLDCMAGAGFTWRDHLVVPPVDYVARYLPMHIELHGYHRNQFTEGMRTLREAYATIPPGGMPLARLQRCFLGDEVRFAQDVTWPHPDDDKNDARRHS